MKKCIFLFALLAAGNLSFAQDSWKIDQLHSKINFAVNHMVVSEVEGNFKTFEGSVTSSSVDFKSAKVNFTLQTASVDTDNAKRDNHLRGDGFFESEKFPVISFKGKLTKDKQGKYQLRGDLTMKGTTKKITFDVSYNGSIDTGNGTKAGFKLEGSINRQEYGLTWQKALASGEYVVGDEVRIRCSLELDKERS